MNKSDIKPNDIVEFKNGKKIIVDNQSMWILNEFYDENMNCFKKEEYTIIKVIRPYYEEIYNRYENKTAVELKDEITRLYERNKR